ncbi:MAG TPA: hypothetical protein DEG43_10530 [Acidimicrobiaceae bacterium]|jgi:PPOX class probable F420-dependent enzyme|nr:hypothetical protein [Acidimicrobiaceae bacterium]
MNWSDPKYVSFSTFRKDGSTSSTPVWWARLEDGSFAFTTDPTSWKVRRLRNNPAVEVRPCTMKGVVAPDAPVARGTASVVSGGPEYASVVKALKKRYGLMVTMIEFGGAIKQLVKRNPNPDCAIIVHLSD